MAGVYWSFRLGSAWNVESNGAREVGCDRIIRFLLTVIPKRYRFNTVLDFQSCFSIFFNGISSIKTAQSWVQYRSQVNLSLEVRACPNPIPGGNGNDGPDSDHRGMALTSVSPVTGPE